MINIGKKDDLKAMKELELLKREMAKQILILLKDYNICEVANYLKIEPEDLIESINDADANYSLYDETLGYLMNKQKVYNQTSYSEKN